jgi:hypothetical protein
MSQSTFEMLGKLNADDPRLRQLIGNLDAITVFVDMEEYGAIAEIIKALDPEIQREVIAILRRVNQVASAVLPLLDGE